MKPKVYVATAFGNLKVAKEVMITLQELGFTITHDWTNESAEGKEGEVLKAYLNDCAERDVYGVRTCNLFFLINHKDCKGGYTELGIALALSKQIIVVHKSAANNIFFNVGNSSLYEDINDGLVAAGRFFIRWTKDIKEGAVT